MNQILPAPIICSCFTSKKMKEVCAHVCVHVFSLQHIPYCSYMQESVEETAEQKKKKSSCLFLPIAATLVLTVLVLVSKLQSL